MRNVGLALNMRENTNRAYPGYANVLHEKRASWCVTILPYIEHSDLYQIWQHAAPVALPLPSGSTSTTLGPNHTSQNPWAFSDVSVFVCPSDYHVPSDNPLSFVVNCGSELTANDFMPPITAARTWVEDINSGVFFNQARADFDDSIPQPERNPPSGAFDAEGGPVMTVDFINSHDGSTYTLLLSENLQAGNWATDPTMPAGSPPTPFQSEFQIKQQTGFVWFVTNKKNNTLPQVSSAVFNAAGIRVNGLADQVSSPLLYGAYPIAGSAPTSGGLTFSRPSSAHPGGVGAIFCDGHYQFIANEVDYRVYTEMMTPNGRAAIVSNGEPATTAREAGWDYELNEADYN